MSLGNSVNKLYFDPILIKLSLNFNSIFIKLLPNFDNFFIELSLNWYKIVSQILQNCHSSCITLLLIPLLWVSVDVIMVYRIIHFPDGEGGGVPNTNATWVWLLKGFWAQTRQSTGGCVAQSRVGRSLTRLSNGLAEIPGRSAFFSQSQWSESWLVIVWLIMLITRWCRIKRVGSLAPYDSPSGVPLSRQWWVQLTVAGMMSGDSAAAGYHVGFWFW